MRIAFVISETFCISPYSGIRIQAQTWGEELRRQGHEVIYVSPWDLQNWEAYDIIHLIGYNEVLMDLDGLYKRNHHIVFSPIIDSMQNVYLYKLMTHWGCNKLRLKSTNYVIRQASQYIQHWYVRSEFEYRYVNIAYGIPKSRITIIPLSYKIVPPVTMAEKKKYCLHVSKLTDTRKNVLRLVKAARKYGFDLVLAGSISSEESFAPIKGIIDSCPNITYLGRVSDETLLSLYKEAKVFARPSINEGVGLVALEAAACGCDIVVTKIGGPKEYYDGMAYVIDPLDVDDIGKSVLEALEANDRQPKLRNWVVGQYGLEKCMNKLLDSYKEVYAR